jgi:hypothetical protein
MVIREPFGKFVDSSYYSELELRGGAVTVSFFEVPPLASDALLTRLHPLLENVMQTVDHLEISCLGVPFSWLEKPIACMSVGDFKMILSLFMQYITIQ